MSSRQEKDAEYKVAIDFGTTFSGFALWVKSRAEESIKRFYDWPGAGAHNGRNYCKTRTALYYVGDAHGNYRLHSWGWPALDDCTDALRKLSRSKSGNLEIWSTGSGVTTFQLSPVSASGPQSTLPAGRMGIFGLDLPSSSSMPSTDTSYGCFVTAFKLDLFMSEPLQQPHLPGTLTTEQLIVDYLQSFSNFIMDTLHTRYDNNVSRMDVEWCLTVPSIWDVQAKEKMIKYAKKAGISNLRYQTKTPVPVNIILEPEGASVYCQMEVSKRMMLRKGDKMMIADVGGGTIDLVVHSKAEDAPESTEVDEEVSSYGDLGGGTFVDMGFFALLEERIGSGFQEICWQEPGTRAKLLEWWESTKRGFNYFGNYSAALDLDSISRRLYKEWQKHQGKTMQEDYNEDFWLEDEDFRRIFNPEIDKVIKLVEMQIGRPDMKVLMVVGGFSASPYLQHRVTEKFRGMVSQILFPDEPGSAIAYGALMLHLHNSVRSRIAPRTYGIRMDRARQAGDPEELVYTDIQKGTQVCKKVFHPFVRKGQKVPCGYAVTHVFSTTDDEAPQMCLELYSSEELPEPKYITSCKHEGGFVFSIPKPADRQILKLPFKKQNAQVQIEVQMVFGASAIAVIAVPSKSSTPKANAPSPILATFFAPLER